MNGIELHDLHKSFGGRTVLRGVSFAVEPGAIVGFVGPNGAGKTTCLRVLLGLHQADRGSVRVLGMDPRHDAVRIRRHCSYLPGETSLYPGMRGREFLRFALGFYPMLHDETQLDLLEAFRLPLHKRVRSYSAGMKQKLALMATLIPDVEVYVLDEPDRALDASARFFLRHLLEKLRRRGKAVLLSSHHLREVETVADRLVFLLDGQVVPPERIAAARAALRQRVRLRLEPGDTPLPDGAAEIAREPDGTLLVAPHGDPVAWLARIPADKLVAAEVGSVQLEDIYRLLTEPATA
ncbi:MAG: ABC transporter ATP-binding protein [Planctomycetes bacterium]|nr:ABC transporter ATP-binding protein [Planctomycetota bacterium]MCB9869379.1 ABC transporter ATP-binding protein [Planctomycetota bacterium]MCB9888564.1 ABC transporter ATP-binding protein [Planctomycetota bacterium]